MSRGLKAYRDTIPEELQEDMCRCSFKDNLGKHANYLTLPNTGDVGIQAHDKCRKPIHLWPYIEVCENCEYYYIVSKYPDKELLCDSCSVYA